MHTEEKSWERSSFDWKRRERGSSTAPLQDAQAEFEKLASHAFALLRSVGVLGSSTSIRSSVADGLEARANWWLVKRLDGAVLNA